MLIIYLVVLIVLVVLHHVFDKFQSSINLLAILLGILIAVQQLLALTTQIRNEVKVGQFEAAFHLLEQYNEASSPLSALAGVWDVRDSLDLDITEVDSLLQAHPAAFNEMIKGLNLLEQIGLAVRVGYADEGTVCEGVRAALVELYRRSESWIDFYRSKSESALDFYVHFEWLYRRWVRNICPSVESYALPIQVALR